MIKACCFHRRTVVQPFFLFSVESGCASTNLAIDRTSDFTAYYENRRISEYLRNISKDRNYYDTDAMIDITYVRTGYSSYNSTRKIYLLHYVRIM